MCRVCVEVLLNRRGTVAVCTDSFRVHMKRSLVSHSLLLVSALVVRSQALEATLFSSEFTLLPAGARQIALGNAGVALALDGLSAYSNPAASSFLESLEMRTEGARLYGGLASQGIAAVAAPLPEGLGAVVQYHSLWSHEILRQDSLPADYATRLAQPSLRADGSHRGAFRNNHHMLVLGGAKQYPLPIPRPPGLSVPLPVDIGFGLNLKYYWQTMDPDGVMHMGMNLNLDAGVLLRIGVDYDLVAQRVSRQLCFGVAVRNLVPTRMIWVHSPTDYSERVYNTQEYGLAYLDNAGLGWLTWRGALSLQRTWGEKEDSDNGQGYNLSRHFGMEFTVANLVDIRGGIADGVVGLGAGVRYRAYSFDYLFRFDRIDYSSLRLALGVSLR